MFPSVLADYEPALPANVGWEKSSFMYRSKVSPENRNRHFYHKHFQTCCDCDTGVLGGSAGVLLRLLTGWMSSATMQRVPVVGVPWVVCPREVKL